MCNFTIANIIVSFVLCFYFKIFIFVAAMTEEPRFVEPIPNVTVALGRDASLPCIVENLGTYKVN